EHGHDGTEQRMTRNGPLTEPSLTAAEQVVSGEDGDGRNGGQNVSRQFRLRKGEEEDGNQRPDYQELRKCISRPAGTRLVGGRPARPPLVEGGANAVSERLQGHNSPGHEGK